MKGWQVALISMMACGTTLADPAAVMPGSVTHAGSQATENTNAPEATTNATETPATAETTNTTESADAVKTTTTAPKTVPGPQVCTESSNYYDLVGGFGVAKPMIGKSWLGVSSTESDWLSQGNDGWQSPFAHLGIGYVYALSDASRGYADKWTWFPTVEPMLSLYYFNLSATGDVYRFAVASPLAATFNMPLRTTNFMIDGILTLATYKFFSVYMLAGVGVASSRLSYSDTPFVGGGPTRPPLSLRAHTEANAAYEWGTGFSLAMGPHAALAFEYLYTHIGNISTSSTGTIGGVPTSQIDPAGFSLRTQALFMDLHIALT